MKDDVNISDIEGFASIKEAAKVLGLSTRRVHDYIAEGRLPAVRAVNALMIPRKALQDFKPKASGRERKATPLWRISTGDNIQYMVSIAVRVKPGRETVLSDRLSEIKKSNDHLFPGTIARYFGRSATTPGQIEIVLIWRGTVMPDEEERRQQLEAFRQELADVLDWRTAHYEESTLLLHT